MKQIFPSPKNLAEICEFGIKNKKFSINALAEIIHQLKIQDKVPVLMLVDNYNFFYYRTCYKNYKYQN